MDRRRRATRGRKRRGTRAHRSRARATEAVERRSRGSPAALRVRLRGRSRSGPAVHRGGRCAHGSPGGPRPRRVRGLDRARSRARGGQPGRAVLDRAPSQQPRLGVLRGRRARPRARRVRARPRRPPRRPRQRLGDRPRALRRRKGATRARPHGRGDRATRARRRMGRGHRRSRRLVPRGARPRIRRRRTSRGSARSRPGSRYRSSRPTTRRSPRIELVERDSTRSPRASDQPLRTARAGCSRACASAPARASRERSRAPRSGPGASVSAE